MPMYDFRCSKCKHEFEDITPSTAEPPVCPECGSASERIVTRMNFGRREKPPSAKAEYHRNKSYNDEKNRYPTKK